MTRRSMLAIILVAIGGAAEGAVDITGNQLGRLTSVGNGQTRTFYEYDVQGRVVATQHLQDSQAQTFRTEFGYPHNPASTPGHGFVVLSQTFPDGEKTTYTYDLTAKEITVRTTLSGATEDIVRNIKHNARGQLTQLELGNGVVTTFTYAETGDLELIRARAVNAAGQVVQDYTYAYDENGNVTGTTDGVRGDQSATYEYDSLDQLTVFRGADGTAIEDYVYDAIGNLTRKGAVIQTYGPLRPDGVKRAHALNQSGAFSYGYDANGNVITTGTATIEWNAENMPTKVIAGSTVTSKSFVGESLWKKVEQTGTTTTTYYLPSMSIENGAARKYYGTYAERAADRKLRFFHPDHLGSSTVMTDQQGAPIRRASYFPWGQDRGVEGYRPKLEFHFKERDAHGFYDFGARIYSPVTGRWLSPDSSIRDGLNRYAYARNNPWTHTDPTGHNTEPAWYWIYSWSPLLERYEVYLWPIGVRPPLGYDRLPMLGGASSGIGGRDWTNELGQRILFQEDGSLLVESGRGSNDYNVGDSSAYKQARNTGHALTMSAVSQGSYWESPALFLKRDAEYFDAERQLKRFANTVRRLYGKSPTDIAEEVVTDAWNAATDDHKNPNNFSASISVVGDDAHLDSFMRGGRRANRPYGEWTDEDFAIFIMNVVNLRTPVLILNYGRGGMSDRRTARLVDQLRKEGWYKYPSSGGLIFTPVVHYTNSEQLVPYRKK